MQLRVRASRTALLACVSVAFLSMVMYEGCIALSVRRDFGVVVWKADRRVFGVSWKDLDALAKLTGNAGQVSPKDVYEIWAYCLRNTPSFDPVCISMTRTYYVLSGGHPPRGDILNSGLLLVRRGDGFVWQPSRRGWLSVGFTLLQREEIEKRVRIGQDMHEVQDVLGRPAREDTFGAGETKKVEFTYCMRNMELCVVSVSTNCSVIDLSFCRYGRK
jgi:hypothetical protein